MDENSVGRGWNDPPPLDLPMTQPVKQSGLKLNKRVAFPLSGGPNNTTTLAQATIIGTTPPKIPVPLTKPSPSKICDISKSEEISIEDKNEVSEVFLESTINNFLNYFMCILDENSDLENRADVDRRLEELRKLWLESKIEEDICNKLILIWKALENKDLNEATKIQIDIATKWPQESGKWIAAIRSVINFLRLKFEQTGDVSQ